MALDSCKPAQDEPRHGESPDHHFPLHVELWAKELHSHPDNHSQITYWKDLQMVSVEVSIVGTHYALA